MKKNVKCENENILNFKVKIYFSLFLINYLKEK